MSRSGYSDDGENYHLWRRAVDRAIEGKRGQAFLRDMIAALDAMPVKELHRDVLLEEDDETQYEACAMGSVIKARGLDASNVDAYSTREVGALLNIAPAMAAEIAFINDEYTGWVRDDQVPGRRRDETPAERWVRMRKWAEGRIVPLSPHEGDNTANETALPSPPPCGPGED